MFLGCRQRLNRLREIVDLLLLWSHVWVSNLSQLKNRVLGPWKHLVVLLKFSYLRNILKGHFQRIQFKFLTHQINLLALFVQCWWLINGIFIVRFLSSHPDILLKIRKVWVALILRQEMRAVLSQHAMKSMWPRALSSDQLLFYVVWSHDLRVHLRKIPIISESHSLVAMRRQNAVQTLLSLFLFWQKLWCDQRPIRVWL